ncbi:MAG: hypothetical protein ACOYN0_10060 [Phycisphaerales bacterium]
MRRLLGPAPRILAAHGLCGACDYGIAGVPPQADGCIVCPECAAAWQADRLTMVGRDPSRLRVDAGPPHQIVDDRLIPLDQRIAWPPKWKHTSFDAALVRAVERELAADRRRRWLTLALALLAPPLILFVLVWLPAPRGERAGILRMVLLFGGIFSGAAYFCWRKEGAVKQVLLSLGRCPNCGHPIAPAPGFDGCTACERCGRAWRMGDDSGRAWRI